eukprot:m.951420 g.951420  ORF g.951420 m.951420 type:complete len:54 (-) comp334440_c0_seq1:129-290(-)
MTLGERAIFKALPLLGTARHAPLRKHCRHSRDYEKNYNSFFQWANTGGLSPHG